MKVLIITDNLSTYVNGVVTTYKNTINCLKEKGYEVEIIDPSLFKGIPLPFYKSIKLSLNPWKIKSLLKKSKADYIHIATEGPLGLFAGIYCRKLKYNFTTSYHTKLPEYIKERFKFASLEWCYKYMKLIHKGSSNILVTTKSMKEELIKKGFDESKMVIWNRGIDQLIFNPYMDNTYDIFINWLKPYNLYVGRVSHEKNIEDFLNLDIPGNKVIVGDGPYLNKLHEKYGSSNIVFVGEKHGQELAEWYKRADAFIFPSKTDTFGLVMIEAMACGTPVVAYNVTGPKDVVEQGVTGYIDNDLKTAYDEAMKLDREVIANVAKNYTWEKASLIFENTLTRK